MAETNTKKELAKDSGKDGNKAKEEHYVVGSFSYEAWEYSKQALAEQERIAKLEKQMEYDHPEVVYAVYCKVIEKELFRTPEGLLYLVHLQDYLYHHESEIAGDIPLIPAEKFCNPKGAKSPNSWNSVNRYPGKKEKPVTTREEKLVMYKVIIAFLSLCILGMLIIAGMSDSPTILNYRTKIQDEYVEWEQLLEEKEAELREREEALENR